MGLLGVLSGVFLSGEEAKGSLEASQSIFLAPLDLARLKIRSTSVVVTFFPSTILVSLANLANLGPSI